MNRTTTPREHRLGIDIGRVIIDGPSHPGGGDTAFFSGDEATMLATPEMPGCVPAIARLTELFGGRVWLVSKCGPRVQAGPFAGWTPTTSMGGPGCHVTTCGSAGRGRKSAPTARP